MRAAKSRNISVSQTGPSSESTRWFHIYISRAADSRPPRQAGGDDYASVVGDSMNCRLPGPYRRSRWPLCKTPITIALLWNVYSFSRFYFILFIILAKSLIVYNIANTFNRSCPIVLGNDYIIYSLPIGLKDLITCLTKVSVMFIRSSIIPLVQY